MLGLRRARPDDAGAVRDIYAPYVRGTAISFEYEVPDLEEIRRNIEETNENYAFVVGEDEGRVLGYARGYRFRARAAYSWSVEVSVYVAEGAHRRGVGRRLTMGLLDELRERGYVTAFAGITLPNAASVGLFESLGFTHCGTFEKVGFKFDQWHDVGFWQRSLRGYPSHPRAVAAARTEIHD
jgi:phosphinothricin acetyltransferase